MEGWTMAQRMYFSYTQLGVRKRTPNRQFLSDEEIDRTKDQLITEGATHIRLHINVYSEKGAKLRSY